MKSLEKKVSSNRNSMCKGPWVRSLEELRNHEKASVLEKQRVGKP